MARILVIEDNADTLQLLAGMTRQMGHEPVCLGTGDEAIETAESEPPDLVVLDLMLPGVSGFEICRRIRRHGTLYTTPVLVLSAMGNDEEVAHALAQGADDFVGKPFEPRNLTQRMTALMQPRGDGSDAMTQLPGAESAKREVQRRISCREDFSLICAEVLGIREYGRMYGVEARNRAIRHLARTMAKCGEDMSLGDSFYLAHMGSGHFIGLVPQKQAESYAVNVVDFWRQHAVSLHGASDFAKRLLHEVETRSGRVISGVGPTFPEALLCVTINDARDSCTAKQMFETLAQLRHKALETRASGLLKDCRAFNNLASVKE